MSPTRRPVTAPAPSFGRRSPGFVAGDVRPEATYLSADARLFALTFAGGFLFMAVYLA